MLSDYFTNLTFWLIVISVLVAMFVFAFCCCLCCRSGDYPGKILEYPATDWQPSAPYCPPQDSEATYYPTMPGAISSCVDGPYVAMTTCVNISDAQRAASSMDPASVPPPSYAQVMRASQIYYSPQLPADLPGPHGPPVPHGPHVPHGLPRPVGPVGLPGAGPYC